jgi:hypothetical protein
VLGLVAERACHAAAPGVELHQLDPGDPAQQGDGGGGADLGLLVAVAVEDHAPPGEPRVLGEHEPAVVDRLAEQLLDLLDARSDALHVGVVPEHRQVLVAQSEQAGRLAADDR